MAAGQPTNPSAALHGRTIVVTGGASGIGRAVSLLCADRGASVAIWDRDGPAAERVADEVRGRRVAALAVACDVSVEAEVERACRLSFAQLGQPHGLFANAGIDAGGLIHELTFEHWQKVLATNLNGIYLACKHVLRALLAADRGGSIVCSSSPAAFVSVAAGGAGAYSASKGAISALVRCLAIDYASHRIRVNAVVPGPTETALMWANVPEAERPRMRAQIASEVPWGRLADPEEPARAVVWLLSDEASYVTGSHLVCDGGMLAKASLSV